MVAKPQLNLIQGTDGPRILRGTLPCKCSETSSLVKQIKFFLKVMCDISLKVHCVLNSDKIHSFPLGLLSGMGSMDKN